MSNGGDEKSEGWLSKLLTVRKIDPGSQSHSTMLSDKDTVFELQSESNAIVNIVNSDSSSIAVILIVFFSFFFSSFCEARVYASLFTRLVSVAILITDLLSHVGFKEFLA